MHPWIMQNIAEQHQRDLQLQADRWRLARSVRARRRALRDESLTKRTARQAEWTLGEQAAWARGIHGRPAAGA